jgi:hypothetical protein
MPVALAPRMKCCVRCTMRHNPKTPTFAQQCYGRVQATSDARQAARKSGLAYAVQWPDGHWTVEQRKPLLRTREMKVLEYGPDGVEYLA